MNRILLIAALVTLCTGCDLFPFPPDVCPEILIQCEEGSVPIDSSGDGCVDSCGQAGQCAADDDCPRNQICDFGDNLAFLPPLFGTCVSQCAAVPPLECDEGAQMIDSDGDGCVDSCPDFRTCLQSDDCNSDEVCDTQNYCESDPNCDTDQPCDALCYGRCVLVAACPEIAPPVCDDGFAPADTDGDGCIDACEPVACAAVEIECNADAQPADTDGDGCDDACVACPDIALPACEEGEQAVSDGRCGYTCEPVACPEIALPTCDEGEQLVDSDDDGCLDSCEPVVCSEVLCDEDRFAVDTDGDGCDDTCFARECPAEEPVCEDGQIPGDSDGDGCNDNCVDAEACLALPSCEQDDELIESTSECLADGRCYTVSVCGVTILCTGG